MRPVLLRMDSFAAFREPTVVDFTDADYFVLVGPTGAGKSTVIDAMTFALYGSVPRWDDRRTVGLALAPTAGRGTVSLVFDAGGERWVVARELRRAASGSVTVKEARLERLVDPAGTAEPEEKTEPVADGAAKVSAAVEDLLGLPFDDFCTCVVLPQGDFADFLHAAPNKRQEKLERILGLGVYDQIMRRANSEAGAQQQRADVLGERLARYDADTPEAQSAAAERVGSLEALETRVADVVPRLATATAELDQAESAAAAASAEKAALAGLRAPDGLAELDARRAGDAERTDAAATSAEAAERADTEARGARAAAPDRVVLEQVRERHGELARLTAGRPELDATRERAREATAAAAAATATAEAAEEDARAAREEAGSRAVAATAAVDTLVADRDALAAPRLPDGLDDLAVRRDAAETALRSRTAELAAAEEAEDAARSALAAAPAREPLEQAGRDHDALAAARATLDAAGAARQEAGEAEARAAERRDTARHHLEHARAALAAAERSDVAATLRPALTEGADCPVCAQTVALLPPPLPDGGVAAARREAEEAERADGAARTEHHRAEAVAVTAVRDADRAAADVARLEAALDGCPDADGVRESLAERERVARAADAAGSAVRTARRARDEADEHVAARRRETDAVAARLRGARDPLTRLEPPPEPDDPVAGWHALVGWSAREAGTRDAALPAAREAAASAVRERDAAEEALSAARDATAGARRSETAAVRAEQEAASALAAADRRAAELTDALDGAPTDAGAAAQLERVAELDRRADAADAALREARDALARARRAAERTGAEVSAAWDALRRSRDPVVTLGAPVPDGTDLVAAWAALTSWAAAEIVTREERIRAAGDAARRARAGRDELLSGLRADLAALDVVPGGTPGAATATDVPADELARRAPSAVATSLAEARADRDRMAERRAEAAELVSEHATARENQQVAKMLGDQLRSDRFPRWLVASALDALVADASESLDVLSGGQFALTHDKGDFLVVDHADADAQRPVKTLSGGETFQASLALALALSDQLSGLAAQGAPRLESIFLDEGFGTLDEANLETVASTLENLATRGDRMVGVITHVPALAERIPVRFTLSRTQRTSTIEREDGGRRGVKFSVDPWDPAYGTSLDAGPEEPAADVETGVEVAPAAWAPVPADPGIAPPAAVLFVDGVRRVDAQVWVGGSDGAAAPGLCASYAAGVVCCCPDGAHLTPDVVVRRGMFTTAPEAVDVVTAAGAYRATTTPERPDVAPMQLLSLALQRDLAGAELVAAASARGGHSTEDDLLVVDGPVRGHQELPRVIGVVKTHHSDYLPPERAAVVPRLAAGERTPVFRVVGAWERYTWYLRLPCPPGAPWAGVVRVECAASLSVPDAVRTASVSQRVLPRFASVAYKDSRAPQNLYPIGGLERELRRRLGDSALLYRALRRAASDG